MKQPLIIGITGGIGGGKSTFSNLLRNRGYLVYDTDVEAKRLQNKHPIIRQRLMELFGEDIYAGDELDRKRLASFVFNNPASLNALNEVVHPVVKQDFLDWQRKHTLEKILFAESAILFESGFNSLVDKVIVITAPEHIRIARVASRDNITPKEIQARMQNQLPEADKINRADIVIDSAGDIPLEEYIDKVLKKWN